MTERTNTLTCACVDISPMPSPYTLQTDSLRSQENIPKFQDVCVRCQSHNCKIILADLCPGDQAPTIIIKCEDCAKFQHVCGRCLSPNYKMILVDLRPGDEAPTMVIKCNDCPKFTRV